MAARPWAAFRAGRAAGRVPFLDDSEARGRLHLRKCHSPALSTGSRGFVNFQEKMPISDLSRAQPTWESQKEALNDGLRTPSLWNITLTPWSWMNISLRRKGVLLKKRGEMSSFKSLTREANAKLDPKVASRYELRSSDSKPIMLTVTQQDSYLAVFTVMFKWNELAASAAVERAAPELPLRRRNPPASAFRLLSPLFCSKSNSFVSSFSCISSSRESSNNLAGRASLSKWRVMRRCGAPFRSSFNPEVRCSLWGELLKRCRSPGTARGGRNVRNRKCR